MTKEIISALSAVADWLDTHFDRYPLLPYLIALAGLLIVNS